MNVLQKLYERDFPIITYQLHGRWYLRMFGHDIPGDPRNVTVLQNGRGSIHRHSSVEESINGILLAKVRDDTEYLKRTIRELEPTFEIVDILSRGLLTTREALVDLIGRMADWWPGIYISIHVPRDERFSASDRDVALKLRERTDKLEYQAFDTIRDSLESLYGPLSKFIFLDEVMSGTIPSEAVLQSRAADEWYVVDGEVLTQEEFSKVKEKLGFSLEENANVAGVTELKGQVAYPGVVRGSIQIVSKKEDLASFKEGSILVSPMTVPTFLPAMHKAIAFVTDEGGITCHAAIVAREMKKPCIIGTKIATKALKNGDMVEVDAGKGVVRILDR